MANGDTWYGPIVTVDSSTRQTESMRVTERKPARSLLLYSQHYSKVYSKTVECSVLFIAL